MVHELQEGRQGEGQRLAVAAGEDINRPRSLVCRPLLGSFSPGCQTSDNPFGSSLTGPHG